LRSQLSDDNVRLLAGLTKAEQGSVTGEDAKSFLAGHMNRTMIEKNATLRNRVFNGYYPPETLGKLNNVSDAEVEAFKKNTLEPVMRGEGGEHTHNASLDVARNAERLYPGYGRRSASNELFYTKGPAEAAKIARLPRNAGDDESTQVAGPGGARTRFRGVRNLRGDEDATTRGGWADKILGDRREKADEDLDRASGKGRRGGEKADEDLDTAAGKGRRIREELEKPIKVNMDLGGSTQFGRASMRREADREVRESRWNSQSDIGAA
jgi:hypothetical protein